jgi:hypothetical protein
MNRRLFFLRSGCALLGGSALALSGCRGHQSAAVLNDCQKDMVGTCAAGAETFKPLIDEAVSKLLARQSPGIQQVTASVPGPKRVCFVGVENKSSEEIGDFKDQLVEVIDTKIVESKVFQPVSRRFVEAGLRTARVRPDELFIPAQQRQFLAVMEQQGQPFDYLLFASLTSGTTRSNGDSQKDYVLTLELVNVQTGAPDKESATIRKGYYNSCLGKLKHS